MMEMDNMIWKEKKRLNNINQSLSTEFNPATETKNTAIKSIKSAVFVPKNSISK